MEVCWRNQGGSSTPLASKCFVIGYLCGKAAGSDNKSDNTRGVFHHFPAAYSLKSAARFPWEATRETSVSCTLGISLKLKGLFYVVRHTFLCRFGKPLAAASAAESFRLAALPMPANLAVPLPQKPLDHINSASDII